MILPRRRKTAGLPAIALALAATLNASCTSPSNHPQDDKLSAIAAPQEDVETIIQRHRSELEELADRANSDNIERGGVIIAYNGSTRLIEIHNQFRDGPKLIDQYCSGDLRHYARLESLINSATAARIGCNPSGAANYYARANTFRTNLNMVQALTGKNCQSSNYQLHVIFSELALHTTYLKEEHAYNEASSLGDVLLHVHTHNDTRTAIDEDTTDYLAPSRQDLLISEHQEGIVSGVNAAGEHRIYHSSKGKYRIIPPETSLALR